MEIAKKQPIVIDQAEDFIKRIHDGDKVITPEAQKIVLTKAVGEGLLRRSDEKHSLAELLGSAMSHYQSTKELAIRAVKYELWLRQKLTLMRFDAAEDLQKYIDLAYTHGVIKDQNLISKLEECQEENEQLKKTKDQLEKENLRLKEENDQLHNLMRTLGGEPSSTLEHGDEDE